jgi:hypothetical protein
MPARITAKAELASLLAKSQETTDANRQAQLRREANVRADRQRLQAKAAKEAAARKRALPEPVGRNIFTAAMGQPLGGVGVLWYSLGFAVADNSDSVLFGDPVLNKIVLQLKVASANGQSIQVYDLTHEWTRFNVPGVSSPSPPDPSGQQLSPILLSQFFPAPGGQALITFDVREGWSFGWAENPFGTTAKTPGDLIGRWGAVSGATACNVVSVSSANASNSFSLYNTGFYPDFNDEGDEPWSSRSESSNVEILNTSSENYPSAYSPIAYAQNTVWGTEPTTGAAATSAFAAILSDNSLPNFFPDAQANWPTGTAAPTALPVDLSSLEASVAIDGYIVSESSGDPGWEQVLTYDFGKATYVASQYAALTAPPP